MFSLTPNPILLDIGFLQLRWYGLVYAVGFLLTYFYLLHLSKKKRLELDEKQVDTLVIYTILGAVLGGRIGEFIFFQTDVLFSNPLQILRIWDGGMAFHGAVLGLIISTTLFCKKYKVPFYHLTDHLMLPASFMLIFGRIANFINSELCGRLAPNLPWAVNLNNPPLCDGYRHPSQLYQALKNVVIFGVLYFKQYDWHFNHLKKKYRPGYFTWLFVTMYGILRVITNIWRDDPLYFFGILSTGQFLSLIMFLTGMYILYKNYGLFRGHKK